MRGRNGLVEARRIPSRSDANRAIMTAMIPLGEVPPGGRKALVTALRPLVISSLFALSTMACAATRDDLAQSTHLSLSSLTERPVIGALGVPLGTSVEIRATVVAGSELRAKAYDGSTLLRVTEVDGRPLSPPPLLEIQVPSFASVKEQALVREHASNPARLVVYEVGRYAGIPRNLPKDVPVWQDRGFGFSTSLVVLAERP